MASTAVRSRFYIRTQTTGLYNRLSSGINCEFEHVIVVHERVILRLLKKLDELQCGHFSFVHILDDCQGHYVYTSYLVPLAIYDNSWRSGRSVRIQHICADFFRHDRQATSAAWRTLVHYQELLSIILQEQRWILQTSQRCFCCHGDITVSLPLN